ncbi:LysR family transcriptional regulator [Amycolatopsis carbonis]|uniref:LysR family transcriptional regulator n=1 Tax=Amycolatopsis carbonis TaxID=715471 RepID=A0A9Y2I9Y3_9PSEU|nr:LysR family transcriptional regulator [Amycolatopsis sp. 2-15]WIX75812.1 LysR family transcriptional regulator [Amycolatopsis sp. 2-15]
MTLGQLNAFVLVARLGSVTDAAKALGVSEPAVSQALAALRQHHGDKLVIKRSGGMTLTAGGSRLLPIASQMVALGAEADAAVRQANGVAARLQLAVTSEIAEFVANPLLEAFTRRSGNAIDASSGLARTAELPVLITNRLADVALGPDVTGDGGDLDCTPIFRASLVVVGSPHCRHQGSPAHWPWLLDPAGADPGSDTGRLLARLGVPDDAIQVFPNQTAAWSAAAGGSGVSVALEHLVAPQLRRRELAVVPTRHTPMSTCWYVTTLPTDRRTGAANSLRHFLTTPAAMHVMRAPGSGVPPSRFRPPVYVTIWS